MAASPVVIDASALIAYFRTDDGHHVAAAQSIGAATGAHRQRLIHPLTLAESLVGAARVGEQVAHAKRIREVGIATTDFDDDAPIRLAQIRTITRLRMPDCCVLDAARQHAAAVLSFDDSLRAAAAGLGIAVVPEYLAEV